MQTSEQVVVKVRELLSNAMETALQRVSHVMQSGALDLDSADNDYRYPKLLVVDALRHAAESYVPIQPHLRAMIDDLANI